MVLRRELVERLGVDVEVHRRAGVPRSDVAQEQASLSDLGFNSERKPGAGDEARTRDPYLGKVVLYH